MMLYQNFGLLKRAQEIVQRAKVENCVYAENGNEITALRIISMPFNLLDWKILRVVGVRL